MGKCIFRFIGTAVLFCLVFFCARAQNFVIDSLRKEISKLEQSSPGIPKDTSLINAYYSLAEEFYNEDNHTMEQVYTNLALEIVTPLLEKQTADKRLEKWLIHGPKGKKFKSKQLQEKLLTINMESMSVQKEILEQSFENWRGELEQLDDVAIIGIRV